MEPNFNVRRKTKEVNPNIVSRLFKVLMDFKKSISTMKVELVEVTPLTPNRDGNCPIIICIPAPVVNPAKAYS